MRAAPTGARRHDAIRGIRRDGDVRRGEPLDVSGLDPEGNVEVLRDARHRVPRLVSLFEEPRGDPPGRVDGELRERVVL